VNRRPIIGRPGSTGSDVELYYLNEFNDATGAWELIPDTSTDHEAEFVYLNQNRDLAGMNSRDGTIALYYRSRVAVSMAPCDADDGIVNCRKWGRCEIQGITGGLQCSGITGTNALIVDDDVNNYAIRDELGSDGFVGYIQTTGDNIEYRRHSNRRGTGTPSTQAVINTHAGGGESYSFVAYEALPTGGLAVYYLHTAIDVNLTITYEWLVSYTFDETGDDGTWVSGIMTTDDSPYDYEGRIGVLSFDGNDYPYVARQSETLGDTYLEVYNNSATNASGDWEYATSIGPVGCSGLEPDRDRAIIIEGRPALLMFCTNGDIYWAWGSTASAADDWVITRVARGAHPEATSMSTHGNDVNELPHIVYLLQNDPTPTPSPFPIDYALWYLQSLECDATTCFDSV